MIKYLSITALIFGFVRPSVAIETNEVSIKIETPNPCHSMFISEVYSNDRRSLVVAQIIPPAPDTGCIASIGEANAQVYLSTKLAPKIEYVVLGKGWCWDSVSGEPSGYIYPRSVQEVTDLKSGLAKVFSQSIPRHFLPAPEKQWNLCKANKQ